MSDDNGDNRPDTLRQGYGLTERDDATGLDHTWFRKLETQAGRWTSPDPYNGSMQLGEPQSFNRYSYVENQPTNYVDPSGLNMSPTTEFVWCEPNRWDPATATLYAGRCYRYVMGVVGGVDTMISQREPFGTEEAVRNTPGECPPVPVAPPGVNIDDNIQTAKDNGFGSWWNPAKGIYDAKAFLWFRDQVKNKGPWDYKQKGSEYQNFGNFNYGATGLAVGIDKNILLREAGRAQIAAGTSREGWGSPGNRLNPFGGEAPFGDDPDDQEQIKLGFAYFEAREKGCERK